VETLEQLKKGGLQGTALVSGNAEKSSLYTRLILPDTDPLAMPPVKRFARLPDAEKTVIRDWINSGAHWPEEEKISYRKKTPSLGQIDADELTLVKKIHAKIVSQAKSSQQGEIYSERLKGIRVPLKMVPVPAGKFLFKGSAPGDEFTAELDSFWIAEKELPWDLYSPFMEPKLLRDKDGFPQNITSAKAGELILAQPSEPYHAMSFGMGVRRHPAIAMTHHAANKYCQWLSWKTGRFYRLPTEAEWEYAARAGRDTKFPWGDTADAGEADAVAWYNDNSNGSYQRVGKKAANEWGVKDMMGNVMEWTLDGFVENRREAHGGHDLVKNPWIKATKPYPHVCKGGHSFASTFGVTS